MTYEISWSDGTGEDHDTLRDAIESVRMQYGEAYMIHEVGQREVRDSDRKIQQGADGYRILIWANEAESTDDNGANAVGSIRLVN